MADIQELELAMVLVAFHTFAPHVFGKELICHSDNFLNVRAFEKVPITRHQSIYMLICEIYWVQLWLQCELGLIFIPGYSNTIADLISRAPLDEDTSCLSRFELIVKPVVPVSVKAAVEQVSPWLAP